MSAGLDRARPHDATSVGLGGGLGHRVTLTVTRPRPASAGAGVGATFQGQNVSGAVLPGKRTLSVMEWEGIT